jgi:hypothetical protein
MLSNIEKGDTVVIRDTEGITHKVTVLSVKPDYERPGAFIRFDYINYGEASPMRRTAYPKELMSIVSKTQVHAPDPKAPRPGDGPANVPQSAVVLNGKVYVERPTGTAGSIPLTPGVPVPEAIANGPKPVESRIKKHGPEPKTK